MKRFSFLLTLCAAFPCAAQTFKAEPFKPATAKPATVKPATVKPATVKPATKAATKTTTLEKPAAIPNAVPRPVRINDVTRNQKNSATSVKLAENGKALLPITISATASAETKVVVEDFARVLEKMTGAKFEIKTGDGKSGIVIGSVAEFPHLELAAALDHSRSADGVESYAIRVVPNRVLIVGATDLGASNGAYRFLEELGCRWLSPNEKWEVVPEIKTLAWNQEITDRPEILSRNIWFKTIYDTGDGKKAGESASIDWTNWKRRARHRQSFQVNAGHAWDQIPRAYPEEFKAHPKYWPLIGGKRVSTPIHGAQPDISNPELRKLFVRYALDYFRARPTAGMISVGPNDGGAFSQSEEFKKLGTISDAIFGLANEVARAVAKEFPGKMVGLYAYREYSEPPSFKLEPNVYVQITPVIYSKFSREEVIAQWAQKCSNLGFYDYYSVYAWNFDNPPGGNASSANGMQARIREQAAQNASSIDGEASNSWMLHGIGYNVANKVMWNTDADVDAIKNDYLQSAYGAAAKTMRHFHDSIDPDKRPIISKNLIYSLALDVKQASEETKKDPPVLARLGDVKSYLRYLELYYRSSEVKKDAPYETREQTFVDLMKHVYRTRYDYTLHYGLATQNLWQTRAEKTGVVVVPGGGKPKELANKNLLTGVKWPRNPWRDETFYSRAEIETNFQSTLDFFKSDVLEDKTFSENLVPIAWRADQISSQLDKRAGEASIFQVQGGTVRLAVYSAGEAIKMTLKSGGTNGNQKPVKWQLFDSANKLVGEGEVAREATAEQQNQSATVPRAGLYWLQLTDIGAGIASYSIARENKATLQLRRGIGISDYQPWTIRPSRYFYVPKDTKQIQYFSNNWDGKNTLVGPDGKVVFTGGASTSFQSVKVPEGFDGKVWSFAGTGLSGGLWLNNVPPYLAISPDRLLVPREIAEKDALAIQP